MRFHLWDTGSSAAAAVAVVVAAAAAVVVAVAVIVLDDHPFALVPDLGGTILIAIGTFTSVGLAIAAVAALVDGIRRVDWERILRGDLDYLAGRVLGFVLQLVAGLAAVSMVLAAVSMVVLIVSVLVAFAWFLIRALF